MCRHRNKLRRSLIVPVFLVALSACRLLPPEYQPQEDPVRPPYEGPEFQTIEVERGDLRVIDLLHFTYEPIRHSELAFSAGGLRLLDIYVEAGDTVREGELLAELEGGEAAALLEERQAKLDAADQALKDLAEDHALALEEEEAWQQALGQDEATTQAALDQLKKDQDAVIALKEKERAILQLEVEESEEQVRTGQVHAPYDGIVTYTRSRSIGEIVRKDETIVEVSDNSRSIFVGRLMEREQLTPGTEWTIVSDEIPYPVRMIDPLEYGIEPEEGLGYALITVDDVQLEAGAKGKLEIVLEESLEALYLPRRAVFMIDDTPRVYVQNEDGIRVSKIVETGIQTDDSIEIVAGLEEGDSVVIG